MSTVVLLGLVGALVLVWPLAHVIALRNVLLLLLLVWLAIDLIRNPELRKIPQGSGPILLVLAMFAVWMLCVALFVDANPRRSFGEVKAEWLPGSIAFAIGLLLPMNLTARGMKLSTCLRLLVGALVCLSILQVCVGLWFLIRVGSLPEDFFGSFSAHKSYFTYVTAFAASFLIADLVSPDMRRSLGLSAPTLWVGLVILAVATFFSGARNGIVTILIVSLIGALIWLRRMWHPTGRRFWFSIATGCAILAVAILLTIKADSRWARLIATVPIAWNIDANHAWVNAELTPLPLGADGLPVERTAYERISWAHAALRYLHEHPLGIGVTRQAFRELVGRKFGVPVAAHSHNGYLDLGLEVGIPGLALWILFSLMVIHRGIKAGVGLHLGTGAALLLLVVGHCVRTGVDSTLRDHILEQFMFFVGVLLAAVAIEERVLNTNAEASGGDEVR